LNETKSSLSSLRFILLIPNPFFSIVDTKADPSLKYLVKSINFIKGIS
jgi:hypothetical protein